MYNEDRAACRITWPRREEDRGRAREQHVEAVRRNQKRSRAHPPRTGSPINSLRAATAKCSPLRGDNENYK